MQVIMNRRPAYLLLFLAALFAMVILACAAAQSIPQILNTPIASLSQPSSTPPAATTLIPVSTPTNCPRGDCARACLAELGTIAQTSGSSEARPKAAGQGPKGLPATVLVTYPINGDQLGAAQFSDQAPPNLSALEHDTQSQQNIWSYFAAIIPADQRSELGYYIVATDGKGGMLASVEAFSGPTQTWALVVDPADAGRPRDLTFTLLHEFGHLLTLNSSQVQPDQAMLQNPNNLQIYNREAASCSRYFASVGCSLPNSYINQFFNQFWTKIYAQWSVVNAAKDQGNYLYLLARFFRNHETQFVTAYASTSPEEDMAETWAAFVLSPKPAADSIAHQKVLFFYSFPELINLRNQIISNICAYAGTK
jgi:hypothetical protein